LNKPTTLRKLLCQIANLPVLVFRADKNGHIGQRFSFVKLPSDFACVSRCNKKRRWKSTTAWLSARSVLPREFVYHTQLNFAGNWDNLHPITAKTSIALPPRSNLSGALK
jgi:hypothetical protein